MFYINLTKSHRPQHHCAWFFVIVALIARCASKTIFEMNHIFPSAIRDPSSPTTPPSPITTTPAPTSTAAPVSSASDITIGPCTWAIGRRCPDDDVKFYLYTRRNPMDRQYLRIDESLAKSNISSSLFDPHHPTKIIIHGYNSDMFLNPLHRMRDEYFARGEYNIVYVDWSRLSPGPCYMSAVHNTRHSGACVAQLVERILDLGSADMHVIGFSLGAQLANYIARNLGSFLLPRITGLDPAMPLFITAPISEKLDPSDAAYVDVIHTNALVQGKLERCGHADFYMNGGIMQPGCYAAGLNPFACSHQRAPAYFLESIRSAKGFWGWACSSYIAYLLGMCPPTNYLLEAGEHIRRNTRGMFLIETNETSPYALGKWTDLPTLGVKHPQARPTPTLTLRQPPQAGDPLLRQVDQWGKLDTYYNNLERYPDEQTDDPYNADWTYFGNGPSTTTTASSNDVKDNSIEEQEWEESADESRNQLLLGEPEMYKSNHVEWNEYRKNLTLGIVDESIFKVPVIRG